LKAEEVHNATKKVQDDWKISRFEDFGSIKPLGKIMGNNVFTFHRPNIEELRNTLRTFPEPAYWLTSENFYKSSLMKSLSLTSKIVLFEKKIEPMAVDYVVKTIDEIANWFREIAHQDAMILFSLNQEDEQRFGNKLETILKQL